jgi:hypothetical protein
MAYVKSVRMDHEVRHGFGYPSEAATLRDAVDELVRERVSKIGKVPA